MRAATILFATLFSACCPFTKTATPETGNEPNPTDAGPDRVSPASCRTWCLNAEKLGCTSARHTPSGGACEEVCTNFMRSGIARFDLGCRTNARSCELADKCENK